MTRPATKTLCAVAIAAALALAGCGGDDDSTTTAPTTTAGDGEATQPLPENLSPRARGAIERAQRGQQRRKEAAEVSFREPTGPAPTASGSLPNEGTKRVAPGVPTARGGDNSIQEFGVEAPSAERERAARVFQAYLDVHADGEYARACSYMSRPIKQRLSQFGRQAREEGGRSLDCAQVMRVFTHGVPKAALRTAADIRVLSMRVEGGQAFLLYRDGGNLPFSVPMNEEGGAWKVSAIAGSALFLGV